MTTMATLAGMLCHRSATSRLVTRMLPITSRPPMVGVAALCFISSFSVRLLNSGLSPILRPRSQPITAGPARRTMAKAISTARKARNSSWYMT